MSTYSEHFSIPLYNNFHSFSNTATLLSYTSHNWQQSRGKYIASNATFQSFLMTTNVLKIVKVAENIPISILSTLSLCRNFHVDSKQSTAPISSKCHAIWKGGNFMQIMSQYLTSALNKRFSRSDQQYKIKKINLYLGLANYPDHIPSG